MSKRSKSIKCLSSSRRQSIRMRKRPKWTVGPDLLACTPSGWSGSERSGSERERYVPNVVYTCGAMRYNDQIILPYAVSDTFSNFATIKISVLLEAMRH
jgi:hypothetical protein